MNKGEKRRNSMGAKFKSIYVMLANRNRIPNGHISNLVGQGLQKLVNTNTNFQFLWIQARDERPKFFEGTQIIKSHDQSFDEVVAVFKGWLKDSGVAVDKNRWDSYFFHLESPDPTARI